MNTADRWYIYIILTIYYLIIIFNIANLEHKINQAQEQNTQIIEVLTEEVE